LIYGNVLYEALEQFYHDPQWASITDWKAELAPYYDQAKRMLGVATNPRLTPSDEILKSVADDLGVGDTFHPDSKVLYKLAKGSTSATVSGTAGGC
jgi:cholesterol oxidase